MTQLERLTAYLKSLDHHQPVLLMVKMGTDGEPEWWSNQGRVMGVQMPPAGVDLLAALVTPEFGDCNKQ